MVHLLLSLLPIAIVIVLSLLYLVCLFFECNMIKNMLIDDLFFLLNHTAMSDCAENKICCWRLNS